MTSISLSKSNIANPDIVKLVDDFFTKKGFKVNRWKGGTYSPKYMDDAKINVFIGYPQFDLTNEHVGKGLYGEIKYVMDRHYVNRQWHKLAIYIASDNRGPFLQCVDDMWEYKTDDYQKLYGTVALGDLDTAMEEVFDLDGDLDYDHIVKELQLLMESARNMDADAAPDTVGPEDTLKHKSASESKRDSKKDDSDDDDVFEDIRFGLV